MDESQQEAARFCFEGSANDSLKFPEIIGKLIGAGFERYTVDLARHEHTYYLPGGDSVRFVGADYGPIGEAFDRTAVCAAILEAQNNAPGYTFGGFCGKVARAGCTGYLVSFPGQRAVYSGRTGEAHVEHFPQ